MKTPCLRCHHSRLLTVRGVCNPCYTALSRRNELDQYPLQVRRAPHSTARRRTLRADRAKAEPPQTASVVKPKKESTAVRMCEARVAGALHCESEAWRSGLCRGHYAIKDRVVRLPAAERV